MEVTLENINSLAEKLKQKDLEKSLKKVQDYSRIAEQLIIENPTLTVDEIGELYENMLEQNNQIEQPEGQDRD